jgi:hypothetical protein
MNCRRQVNVLARPLGQPSADQRRLVGCVIVHDKVNVQTAWNSGFDLIGNTYGTRWRDGALICDDPAGCDVEGGKQ